VTFWSKLRRLAVVCSIALFIAVCAALLSEDTPTQMETHRRSNTFVEK
jgi:hypothetical protein